MAQNTYLQNNAPLLAGVVEMQNPHKIDSKVAEGSGGLAFGRGVIRGTTDNRVALAAASGVFLGVTVRDHSIYHNETPTNPIAVGDPVGVITHGVIMGELAVNATQGALAYILVTVGADQGKFTTASNSGANYLCGKFLQSGSDGDIVRIEIQI